MALVWTAEQLRLTLFSPATLRVEDSHWKILTGQDESESRTNIVNGRVLSGEALGGRLALGSVGNRLDATLVQPPDPTMEKTRVAWGDQRDVFVRATESLLDAFGVPIIRIAFGATVHSSAPTLEEAYLCLSGLLKSVQVSSEMREMFFRINWMQPSAVVPDLKINRITNWSVVQVALVELNMPNVMMPNVMVHRNGTPAVRLEMDHNTDPARTEPFDIRSLQSLYKELVELASENAAKGERP